MTLAASLISHFIRAGVETRLVCGPITDRSRRRNDSITGANRPVNDMDDSGFGVGIAHSYKMFYQLARDRAGDGWMGASLSVTRSDDRFLIVIAAAQARRI